MAELANEWIRHNADHQHGVLDANYIGKLERGMIRWPQATYREALRSVLRVGDDSALGFRRPRRSRHVYSTSPDGWTLARTGAHELQSIDLAPAALPSTIGRAHVDQIVSAADAFRSLDHSHGSGMVRDAVTAQLRYSLALLSINCAPSVRPDLFSAVGALGQMAAAICFDSYAHDDARKVFKLALTCAEEAGDWHLRAKILSSMARQSIWCGDADSGLTLVEFALVRSDRLTATERAMLLTARARALAKLGRAGAALSAIAAADEEFGSALPEENPRWMAYYDAAQHAGDTGNAMFDLAARGRRTDEAFRRLSFAVENHEDGYARSRTLSAAKLASLEMIAGDPDHAVTTGHAALDGATSLTSRRAVDELRELAVHSRHHHRREPVVLLMQRLTQIIGEPS